MAARARPHTSARDVRRPRSHPRTPRSPRSSTASWSCRRGRRRRMLMRRPRISFRPLHSVFDQATRSPAVARRLVDPDGAGAALLGPSDDVLVPDQAGWRRERMPKMPTSPRSPRLSDWICEVIPPSPSTGESTAAGRCSIYAREGVGHLWLVDPIAHTLEVFRLEEERWIVCSRARRRRGGARRAVRRARARPRRPVGGVAALIQGLVQPLPYRLATSSP